VFPSKGRLLSHVCAVPPLTTFGLTRRRFFDAAQFLPAVGYRSPFYTVAIDCVAIRKLVRWRRTDDSLVGTCAFRRLLCPSSFEELVALLRTEKIAAHALVVVLSPLNALLPSFVLAVIPRAVGVLSHEYALQLMGAIETTAAAAGIVVLNFGADGEPAACVR
jgi:hypothetical protein